MQFNININFLCCEKWRLLFDLKTFSVLIEIMDKTRYTLVILLTYLQFVFSQDKLSTVTISSKSRETYQHASNTILKEDNATPTASLILTMLTENKRTTSSTGMKLVATKSSSQEDVTYSAALTSNSLQASPSIQTTKQSPNKQNQTLMQVGNLSKSVAFDTQLSYSNHPISSQIDHEPGSLVNTLVNATASEPQNISFIPQTTINRSIIQPNILPSKQALQTSNATLTQSSNIPRNSAITKYPQNFAYTSTHALNGTSTTLYPSSTININHSQQLAKETSSSNLHNIDINSPSLQSAFSSIINSPNNTFLDRFDTISSTPHPILTSVPFTNIHLLPINTKSSIIIPSSTSAPISQSLSFLTIKSDSSSNAMRSTSNTSTSNLSQFGLSSTPSVMPESSSIILQTVIAKVAFGIQSELSPSKTLLRPFVTPTKMQPNGNVDVEKKDDKNKGFPAWIAIVSAIGAFVAIFTIVAVTLKFVRWNKDHGDYSLWVSNLELQPITSRNAEVLT